MFGVAPLIIIYYAYKDNPCKGVRALFIYGLMVLFANAIMFIVGTSMEYVVVQKVAGDKANPVARPTTDDVKLAAIRKEALASRGA